ncbi:MAG: hypothetical protein M1823_002087 [Watsoniomyces obsoletus]|nr:MAG: hypothetical protein M1823_002087 [Watsoniomyces obsoletus]
MDSQTNGTYMPVDELPAMKTKPKCIFFTDFDGTITMSDSNDYLTDNLGFGQQRRRQGNIDTLEGKVTFRDAFKEMLDSIQTPFSECVEILLRTIKLDPYFKEFYKWSIQHNVPVIVLSSGMEPIIRALLVHLIGPDAEKIEIVSNDVKDRPGMSRDQPGGWEITFHDDRRSLAIKPYANLSKDRRPTLLFAGDGTSDLSAARETDLLFAKAGLDLVTYCEREGVPFTTFENWSTILETTKRI